MKKINSLLFLIILVLSLDLILISIFFRKIPTGMMRGIELGEIIYVIPLIFSYVIGFLLYLINKE